MEKEVTFKPGSYQAKLSKPVHIKTKVTVNRHQITDVRLASYAGEQKIDQDLKNEFKGQILKAQSVNIDGVSSASILTKAVKSVVGQALAQARTEN